MRLVHYSKTDGFKPKAIATADQGKGCFFYPDGNHVEWHGRMPTYWNAPDNVIIEVQRFDVGEFDSEVEVIEVFVKAKDLKRLQEVY